MSFESTGTFPQEGQQVRVVKLTPAHGLLVVEKHLKARRSDATGIALGYVAGHGGDVWWVKHDDGDVAAYSIDEIAPV